MSGAMLSGSSSRRGSGWQAGRQGALPAASGRGAVPSNLPPFSGTLTTVPSSMRSSACCTPSPETSRVMEMFSDRLVILSTWGRGGGGRGWWGWWGWWAEAEGEAEGKGKGRGDCGAEAGGRRVRVRWHRASASRVPTKAGRRQGSPPTASRPAPPHSRPRLPRRCTRCPSGRRPGRSWRPGTACTGCSPRPRPRTPPAWVGWGRVELGVAAAGRALRFALFPLLLQPPAWSRHRGWGGPCCSALPQPAGQPAGGGASCRASRAACTRRTWVRVVASLMAKGTLTMRARVLASSVLPQPVGPCEVGAGTRGQG